MRSPCMGNGSVSLVHAVDGRGEVWLVERTSGKDWKLHDGERLEIGLLRGTVRTIGTHDVTVDVGGRLRRYRTGDNLGGGEEMQKP